jgi:hypothetical protein
VTRSSRVTSRSTPPSSSGRSRRSPPTRQEPLYALFILDDPGKFRVWAVLDKSKKDLLYYDVLYFDLDGSGDLTEKGKRFQGTYNASGLESGTALPIKVGKVPVPGTGIVHTEFVVYTVPKADWKGIWFGLRWAGEVGMSGGYHQTGYDLTSWGKTKETAPVFRPTPNGPLSFAIWGRPTLRAGRPDRVSFLVGNKGSGPDTLCPVPETFIVPEKDRIYATVIAKDASGKEVKLRTEIKGHC